MKNTIFDTICNAMIDKETDIVDADEYLNGNDVLSILLLWAVAVIAGVNIGNIIYLAIG